MRRRDVIALLGSFLGGAAAAWPLAARGQPANPATRPATKPPTIGFTGADSALWSPWTAAFVKRLGELGWVENRTVTILYRWNEGAAGHIADIAAEFVKLNVDVIVTAGGEAAIIKKATSDIPVVFAIAPDPIGNGLVTSLERPGGNLTGLASPSVGTERLKLVGQILPQLHRVGIIYEVSSYAATLETNDLQAAARNLGLEATTIGLRSAAEIPTAFAAVKAKADVLAIAAGPLIGANSTRFAALALAAKLPTIFNSRDLVRGGGLLSYALDYPALFQRAADITDKILRGTKPDDIPVELPTKFELAVNLRTANALGLTIPPALVASADEVIR
jgi:putative ABC transport system substrate-binding protein